ncbi:HupE/UreJ family protein [Myxococcota bacterium]|nr:HupE/UreJ family protein [Myxococcota bacterium]MCZ7616896.1 HupE/UreJ family protein [Myxococcota bacterium]
MTNRPARIVGAAVLAAIAVAAVPDPAGAHGRSLSWSSWRLTDEGAHVRVRVPLLELTRLGVDPTADPSAGRSIARQLAAQMQLTRGGEPCGATEEPWPSAAPAGQVVYEWRVRCGGGAGPLTITSSFLLDEAPSHLHFARVEGSDGVIRERILSDAAPSWSLGESGAGDDATGPKPAGTSFAGYVALGIEHIATGWDHLAFVLALLLLAASLREVAGLVTGFTVAHSVTLALAVLGVVRPEPAAVEALIGFSIALVAAENGWLLGGRGRALPWIVSAALLGMAGLALAGLGAVPAGALAGLALFSRCHFALLERAARPAPLRAAVAFAFGLIHGFGFAGILAELALPTNRLVPALLGFNVGVELGQLAIVAVAWPALRGLARIAAGRPHRVLTELGSAAICGLGLFWFLARTFE